MSLADFVRRAGDTERTLTVVNRTGDDAVQGMLESLFADQPVRIEEVTREDVDESNLVVLSDETEEVVGVSSFESVRDTMLFVNSDLYITGARKLDEMATPRVLAGLDELQFSVRGYPDSDKEKMLLIEMSRYVEARALEADDGVLHTGFQQLSRIDDELGTRRVYERLAASDVDVNVYGSGTSRRTSTSTSTPTTARRYATRGSSCWRQPTTPRPSWPSSGSETTGTASGRTTPNGPTPSARTCGRRTGSGGARPGHRNGYPSPGGEAAHADRTRPARRRRRGDGRPRRRVGRAGRHLAPVSDDRHLGRPVRRPGFGGP
ncbi:MAG: DICT sensory domain-containing protein [Haloferacaceae archaeon]